MRVSRYPGKWFRRVMRVSPVQRQAVVEIATLLGITVDGVCRLALRAYAARRGHDLPGFKAIDRARAQSFIREDADDRPRVWIRLRDSWEPIIEAMFVGECKTLPGVIRQAITEFSGAGADVWHAAMTTTPAVVSAPQEKGTSAR